MRSKTTIYLVLAIFAFHLSLFTSCGGPKIIPDDRLVEIFRDVYLTNAVSDRLNATGLDSLNIYEPIFARQGYTSQDVRYTIGNFAKRKSASISDDIVGRAMDMLRAEGKVYRGWMAARDTIANIARFRFRRTVLTRDRIAVRRVADTGLLRITLPAAAGNYTVEYGYEVDSLEQNEGTLRTNLYVVDGRGRNIVSETYRLGRAGHGTASQNIVADTTARTLVIDLNPYSGRNLRRPALTIDSLRVTYYLPDRVALDSLEGEWFDYFARTFGEKNFGS